MRLPQCPIKMPVLGAMKPVSEAAVQRQLVFRGQDGTAISKPAGKAVYRAVSI
jgi:hypothetical protein